MKTWCENVKKVFLEKLQNSQEKPVPESSFDRLYHKCAVMKQSNVLV